MGKIPRYFENRIFSSPLRYRSYQEGCSPLKKGRGSHQIRCHYKILSEINHLSPPSKGWFHHSHYRDFKAYYLQHVCIHLRDAFPGLVSYSRFVELIPSMLLPLCAYLRQCQGTCSGISFLDSTPLGLTGSPNAVRIPPVGSLALSSI